MLPQKPYRPTYKKFGLIPKRKEAHIEDVPVTIQTFTFFTLLAPLMKKKGVLEIEQAKDDGTFAKSRAK